MTFEIDVVRARRSARPRSSRPDRRAERQLQTAGVHRTGPGRRRGAGADRHRDRRRQLQARRDRRARHAADACTGIAQLAPGAHREHAERRPGHDQRRVRVRQRVHAERRRRQRQPVRLAAEPLHRGRDRGDAGSHLRHHRRIRPVHRRRRQRHHQERRQHVLRQLPDELLEPDLDQDRRRSRPATRRSRRRAARRRPRARRAAIHLRSTLGGPIVRIGCGSSAPTRLAETSTSASLPHTEHRRTRRPTPTSAARSSSPARRCRITRFRAGI